MRQSDRRILIADDDEIIVNSLQQMLQLEGYQTSGAKGLRDALTLLEQQPADLILSDVNMPGGDGFELLRTVRKRWPETVVVMITGYGTIESAVEAIKMGAYDYLTKPIMDDELRLIVQRALSQQLLLRENRELRRQLDDRCGLDRMIGQDHRMLKIYEMVEAVASTPATVLIQGDSGTGKSLVARIIHEHSDRNDKPLIEVACGALPETLLESELFGHLKGSFTGATRDKQGKFKAADGGTLFLDEIATASPSLQVKLLRAIQERCFEPVGSNKTETVDVRLILASNVDLESEVEAGTFRRDLFYRVNVVTILMPPLCERVVDIPLLARRFLEQFAGRFNKNIEDISPEAIECMTHYHWPGNVRELENTIERAVVLTRDRIIDVADLPPRMVERAADAPVSQIYHPAPLRKALEAPERAILEAALRHNGWNRQQTAETLEINRTTLYKKMKRYGLDKVELRR